jgi:NitT/TauT family transport system substrate-binding protein
MTTKYDGSTRREVLRMAAGGTALAATGGLWWPNAAHSAEALKLMNLGFVLGIHCAPTKGIIEELPKFGVQMEMKRFQKLRDNVQAVLGGAGDVGVSGPIILLRSIQAGNDVRILGNFYVHTSLVVVVDADKIKTWQDFTRDDVTVGINSQGDITQVMTMGGLIKNKIDLNKVKWADIGGSGARLRGLLGKRVQATVIHFDQVARVQKEGNYKVMLVPAEEYSPWVNEVVYTTGAWLEKGKNRETAVKLMKSVITAGRMATKDFGYYKDAFTKYATIKGKDKMPEAKVRSYWDTIANKMGVWPADNAFKTSNFEKLMPYYVAAKAVTKAPIDLKKAVDESIVQQALKELG